MTVPGRTDELLDEVAAYADRLGQSDKLADTGSMAAAEALAELYEKREWVDEWNEQSPIKERKAYIGGRPPDPEGRNRFTQWLVWKEAQRQRKAPQSRTTYKLLEAHELSTGYLPAGQITSEWALRPLQWLRKQLLADRAAEVWDRAVMLAGSPDRVTNAHTTQALSEWKRDVLGGRGVRQAVSAAKAERHRIKAEAAVRQLFDDGDEDQVKRFSAWYAGLVNRVNAEGEA